MFVLIAALIFIVIALSLAGQGATYYSTKQDNKKSMEMANRNYENWAKRTAQENDYYYDPACKSFDPSFYSDGSIRIDHTTKKTYTKGEYMCDSQGNNCQWQKVGPEVKRPPSK